MSNDRDFTAFMDTATSAPPSLGGTPSPTTEDPTPPPDAQTSPPATAESTPKRSTPKAKRQSSKNAPPPLRRTTVSVPPEQLERIRSLADDRNVWNVDIVHEALDAHLADLDDAPRRKGKRGRSTTALSLNLEPDYYDTLKAAGGPHASVSWVVTTCVELYLEANT